MKLNRRQLAERDELAQKLAEASLAVSAAVDQFNLSLEDLKEPVSTALEKYNEVIDECRNFVGEIVEIAEAEIDAKSEKWQESERGQAVVGLKDQWESADFDGVELDLPDEVSFDDPEHGDGLLALPADSEEV